MKLLFALPLSLLLMLAGAARAADPVIVGSKVFAEAYILAEITAQLLEAEGFEVERKLGLGGTQITMEAIKANELHVYSDYTGTLIRAVLKRPGLTREELDAALAEMGLVFRAPLGFNNSYAIAVTERLGAERNLQRVSDLARHPDLEMGFSYEFMKRGDGWPALQATYGLPQQPAGLEHALAYRALDSEQLDVTDAYTTDGELDLFELRLLEDDRGVFPVYDAGLLTRDDMPADVVAVISRLEGLIDEPAMRGLNRRVAVDGESPAAVAADFLVARGLVTERRLMDGSGARMLSNTVVHLKLTVMALGLGCLVAIPLALFLSRYPRVSSAMQYLAGLIQTIPALALLALLIPVLGLGDATAIMALFLYSLLPIVRNTVAGLFSIDPLLKEVADSLGLTPLQRLWRIELPLAIPTILAGVKTAAIISIGTATLAAFVGAGGLGQPIITGLSLNDHRLILEGAIPAALLAIVVELLFEGLERRLVPAHLRSP